MIATVAPPTTLTTHKDRAKYFPAIDGLRAIAVLLVLVHHYMPEWLSSILGLGDMGVDIFFVISGFLITSILLSYKKKATTGEALKVFYMRRFFRIFPLYYLYLFIVLAIAGLSKVDALYSFLYAQNFNIINNGWGNLYLAHLWSLSVEEQFYLAWPLLVLTIPKDYIKFFMVAVIAGSFLFAFSAFFFFEAIFTGYMHTVSCLQALAAGGLLAVYFRRRPELLRKIAKRQNMILAGGIAVCLASLGGALVYPSLIGLLRPSHVLLALTVLIALISVRSSADKGMVYRFFDLAPLKFIGRISYGIYIYHFAVKYLLDPYVKELLRGNDWLYWHSYIFTVPLYSVITIGISYLSFRYFEAPINRLKDHFRV